jgi:RNA-binding protein NOB1
MAENPVKPVHSLVLDAGPILKNVPPVSTLLAQCNSLYTGPAVVDEIRDAVTRARVETTLLPFLQLRTPKPASIKAISDFARRTGDLEVLSRPDIQILALAYELECERNHGDWRLRSLPGQKRLNGAPPASLTGIKDDRASQTTLELTEVETQPPVATTGPSAPASTEAISEDPSREAAVTTMPEALRAMYIQKTSPEPEIETSQPIQVAEEVSESESEDSDSDGWITPSNLKHHQAKDPDSSIEPQEEAKTMQVATMTSDFAMQNVLLRMNLNLLSPSLQRIRQLKTWVLRCHACFDITRDMSKQFCSRCGKPTLLRTSCSTDNDGNFKLHLKKNMQWNNRGNVFSIPKPVAGSSNGKVVSGGGKGGWGQELILAEDQKEYIKAMTTGRRKKERDLMDEDYLPSILSGDRAGNGGKPKVGAGKNVNSRKRHK